MKKSFAITVIIIAVFSILSFSLTASEDAPAGDCVNFTGMSGTKSNMTFYYDSFANCSSSIHRIQVSNSSSFSYSVTVPIACGTQTSGVDCSALNSGTAYLRAIEISEEGIEVISCLPIRQFTLP
jgi:hypothetical protein